MKNLTDKEVKRLPYYPNPRCEYLVKYPQLKEIPEIANYNGALPFRKIFTYIILYYSKNTPLIQITDHNDRKRAAAEMSEFTLKTEKYQDVVMARDKDVNKVIMAYLRTQKSFAWSKLCGFIDSFYHQLGKLQGGQVKDNEKTKELLGNITTTEEEIEKTLMSFLNGDNSEGIKELVLQTAEDERIDRMRPENMAEAIAEGKLKELDEQT